MQAADVGRHAGAPGTEAKPWGKVPTSNFPGSPRAEPEPSQCLPSIGCLAHFLRGLCCFQEMLTSQGLNCQALLAVEAGQALPLLPLLQQVPCRTLQHIRHYLKIKTHVFAGLCDFHCVGQTLWRKKASDSQGQPQNAQCHTKEVWPVSAQRGEQLILPPGLSKSSPTCVLDLDFEGRAFQVEGRAHVKGVTQEGRLQRSETVYAWQFRGHLLA